ncbi:BZ3500_MvSof-1268-A1-R1_Chr1-3g02262 [Microbotryum saponariae]|uniref:BZ3500_MvSof-1268-A1-R1_Chr1-3g02262 protein n=1 Tax=Microbotryum saponariae TaxID=289078 RepID=A0A2X0LIB0_9BASI|nr:BZ3500_MvSof-1268-A1-R1_Chr1-3g02262 [Microbotryum saponariae]SCZ95813.1 BZ3501_MvSof-1269-A2-R1_Chr1-3g01865 [Microbotryum saponariae]
MPLLDKFKGLLLDKKQQQQQQQPSTHASASSAAAAPSSSSSAASAAPIVSARHQSPPASSAAKAHTNFAAANNAAAASAATTYATSTSPTSASASKVTSKSKATTAASPATAATTASSTAQATMQSTMTQHAEELVRKDNANRAKREHTQYEGLPDGLVLGVKMGDGAFSNVFVATLRPNAAQLAIDPTLGKSVKVAVKCVRKYELNSSQGLTGKHVGEAVKKKPRATERANILKEVQIMRGLNHPSIVRLLNFTESREHYFLTLELMEGGELFHQIVKLTYFSEELSRHVILQVAHGIRYLHEEKGVVHRKLMFIVTLPFILLNSDIKPENILFDAIPIIPSRVPKNRPYDEEKEDEGEFLPGIGGGGIGRVKIADFGLSKIVWNEETMTPCGTVGYTAPEIVKDERYSKSVDMWALGCVLYTLLCGFPPFYDESINVLTEKVARGYYTFLSPWWDDISASSKDLITHLLDVDPEKRYTIDEFLAHPWCKEKSAPSVITPNSLETLAPGLKPIPKYQPLDSPLLAPGGRRAMPSPGVASLKEAFDVTYAVHRMEEEGARRRAYNGPGGAGRAGFLHGLNEEEDEDEDIETTKRRYGAEVSKAIEDKRREVQDPNRKKEVPIAPQQYQGWGGADRKMAEAALYDGRAGPRDRGSRGRKGGFELALDKATLLGRRKGPVLDNLPEPMRVD